MQWRCVHCVRHGWPLTEVSDDLPSLVTASTITFSGWPELHATSGYRSEEGGRWSRGGEA